MEKLLYIEKENKDVSKKQENFNNEEQINWIIQCGEEKKNSQKEIALLTKQLNTPEVEAINPEELINSNISSNSAHIGKLFESPKYPNKIIRMENGDELLKKHKWMSLEEIVETGKNLFKELKEKYDISVHVDFSIGKDKEWNTVVYSIVDKINWKNSQNFGQEETHKVKDLYTSITKYFIDKSKSNDFRLRDIYATGQYAYGEKNNSKEKEIHFIDTDIRFTKSKNDIYLNIYRLSRSIVGIENNLGIKMNEVRDHLYNFLQSNIPDKNNKKTYKNFEETKKILWITQESRFSKNFKNKFSQYNPPAIPKFE